MSDKSSMLGNLGKRLREGVSRMNQEAKDKAEGRSQPSNDGHQDDAIDDALDDVLVGDEAISDKERIFPGHDEPIDDAFIIEGEAQQQKPKPKGLDKKQKLLVIAALVMGGLYWTQSQEPSPIPTEVAETEPAQSAEKTPDVDGPAFDLGNTNTAEAPIETVTESNELETQGFGSEDGAKDAANDPLATDLLTADLNEQLTSIEDESNEILDPFTGKVKPQEQAAPLQVSAEPAKEPAKDAVAKSDSQLDLAMIGGSEDSPFDEVDSNSTELSGTKIQNADSRTGELKDQGANADVAGLTAKIAEKDGRISELETEVSNLKTDLEKAKVDVAKLKKSETPSSNTSTRQTAKPTQAPQRSPSTQRVASAPKAIARPQVCVTAVAQAARNCTTCVPHAFITHKGVEDMVGQGDFLEGLRVSIVGDRLDLQNAKGEVVHKFWSSPNGCAAG